MSLILVDVLAPGGPRPADPEAPLLHADDLGAVRGDGVFETLLVRDGRACNLARHEARFRASAAMLRLPEPDPGLWRRGRELALAAWPGGEAAMRWVYSRGRESTGRPTGYILISPAPPRRTRVRVLLAERGFSLDAGARAPWALIGAKTLSYAANMAALRHAREHGHDDVLFTTAGGELLEGPTSTLVLVRDGALATPDPGEGILPGTTQAALFAEAAAAGIDCAAGRLNAADLRTADSAWLVSSVRIAARITAVDGIDLADPGEAAERDFRGLCDRALAR